MRKWGLRVPVPRGAFVDVKTIGDALTGQSHDLRSLATGVEREWTLLLYSVAALVWSVLGAGFAILLSMRYYHRLTLIAPKVVLWAVFGAFYALLFLPVVISLGKPLLERRRRRSQTEVEGAPA